ncbi:MULTISPECIES: hypothetical protein [Paraburkholderia]|uniref:Restriction endonuclease n=1 Tax=Paraburkholderia podalyriae TaxID=1938811 RepID=A0ABR7PGC0_9BURK|nr:hypothetical protein [Paraburkholderia podalyriae]MBC8745352.1 hypothetical protein [Paraburkholderia podalyriae]
MSHYSPFDVSSSKRFEVTVARNLPKILSKYSKRRALSAVSGLLTLPQFQANTYRLEILAHLIAANCTGETMVGPKNVLNWLNRQLGTHPVATMEDPPEDVFVTNIVSLKGEFLVLPGLWETPDDSLNLMLEVFERASVPTDEVLQPVYALLALSHFILQRAGLSRWTIERSVPKGPFPESIAVDWKATSVRAIVGRDELKQGGISLTHLQPFIFRADSDHASLAEHFEESPLQQCPLVEFADCIVLSLPTAVTYAARRYLLRKLLEQGQIRSFQEALNNVLMARAASYLNIGGRHMVEKVPLPDDAENCGALGRSAVFRLGQKRFFHLFVLWDDLEQSAVAGLLEPREYGSHEQAMINNHVTRVRSHVESIGSFAMGHTLGLFGHLGQAIAFDSPFSTPNWTFDLCRLQELEFILWDQAGALNRIALMLTQRARMEAQGYEFGNPSGLLNLYAYWLELDCHLSPPDLPRDRYAHVQLGNDHLTAFRVRHRRSMDRHCEPDVWGRWDTVFRANRDAVYPVLKSLPVYLSITRLRGGGRCFCIRVRGTSVWVSMIGRSVGERLGEFQHKAWEELQFLLPMALLGTTPPVQFAMPAVEVLLDLRTIRSIDEAKSLPQEDEEYLLSRHTEIPLVKVTAGAAFLRTFSGVSNDGERKLLAAVLDGLEAFRLPPRRTDEALVTSAERAKQALGAASAKVFHAFESYDPIEYLLSKEANPIYERPDEHVGAAQRTAFEFYPVQLKPRKLSPQDSCKALNQAVTHLMHQVAKKLSLFNQKKLVMHLLFLHESQLNDKLRWRSTARAVQALYGAADGVGAARKADAVRAEVSVTLRTLVEAAVCESSTNGGELPDDFSTDELYGLMCTLVSLGRHSETIYHGLSSSGITIYPSGAYAFSPDVLDEIGTPYRETAFAAGFADAAASYEDWVLPSEPQSPAATTNQYEGPVFRAAFKAEYCLEFSAFTEISAAIFDSFITGQQVVTAFTRDELLNFMGKRDVRACDVDAFLKCFALPARATWAPQSPVKVRDVEPWRFERRLSVMLRPLITCVEGDVTYYVVGMGTLRDSVTYLIDSTVNARFDKDVFESREMRSYVGGKVDEAGRHFTHEVASALRELGWNTEEEVKMTQLGAPKSPNLGDVDVLAWLPSGEVLAIECKRLKSARTISEIAQCCARFAGREGDHLHKHLRRMAWIRANHEHVAKYLKLSLTSMHIENPLVTNVEVPFSYVKDLPLPSDRIVSLGNLREFVAKTFQS